MSLMKGGGARVHNGVIKEIVVGFPITTPRARGVGKKKTPAYITVDSLGQADKKGVVFLFEGGPQNSIIPFEYVDS